MKAREVLALHENMIAHLNLKIENLVVLELDNHFKLLLCHFGPAVDGAFKLLE